MEDFYKLCPVCGAKGNTTFLNLRQINMTTAVYLCKDIRCSYPQGHSWIFVVRNLYKDDECDSDLSDDVNDDIEEMENALKETCESKATEDTNNIIPNEQILNTTKVQENMNISSSTKTDELITNIVETTVGKSLTSDERIYNLCAVEESMIDNSGEQVECFNSGLQDLPSKITITQACNNKTNLKPGKKVNNIIIDDPEGLFNTLDLPCNTNTSTQPKVLASGVPDSETVNLTLPNTANLGTASINNHLVENKNSNNVKLHVQLINKKQDNISNLKNKEDNDLDTLKMKNLNIASKKEKLKLHNTDEIYIEDDPVESTTEAKHASIEKVPEKWTEIRIVNNLKKKNKKLTGRPKPKTLSDYLILPSVEDIDTDFSLRVKKSDFENVFKSKLKISAKKEKQQEFCFPESIVQEAKETVKEVESKINSKKKSLVSTILGKTKKKPVIKTAASRFEGFKYTTEIIKLPNHLTRMIANEQHIQKNVGDNCNKKLINTNLGQEQPTTAANNTFPSDKTASNNSNFVDETLNDFFNNIEHVQLNNSNDNINIAEIDEILNSLSQ